MDTTAPSLSSTGKGDSLVVGEENGLSYWKHTTGNNTGIYIDNMPESNEVSINNISYLVYDFDISADEGETLASGGYLRPTFRGTANPQQLQFIINADTYNNESNRHISISTKANTTLNYGANIDIENDKWVGVSIVLDFTKNASDNQVTYYVYINGVYAGQETITGLGLTSYRYLRIYSSGENGPSINWANFTLSYFANGYTLSNQTLGEDLAADGDLAYCLASPNDTGSDDSCTEHVDEGGDDLCDICGEYVGTAIASIGDVKYDNIEDLQYAIKDGVEVTIYKNITDVLFYPTDATVSFVDMNDVAIGEAGALVTANLHAVDTDKYDWVVVANGTVTPGSTEDNTKVENDDGTYTVSSDALHNTIKSNGGKEMRVVLFDNITMYGSSSYATVSVGLTVNLNGHKLTVDNNLGKNDIFRIGNEAQATFLNGELEYITGSTSLLVSATADKITFLARNCDITTKGALVSQRGGTATFDGCNITTDATLASLTAKSNKFAHLYVYNSEITGEKNVNLFQIGPQNGNGSVSLVAYFENSNINVPGNILYYDERSSGVSDTNNFTIDVIGSELKSTRGSIFADYMHWANVADPSEVVMTTNITFNVKEESTLWAYYYIYSRDSETSNYRPDDYSNASSYNFVLNADATSKIYAREALANKVYTDSDTNEETGETTTTVHEHDCVVIVFNLVEGVAVNFKQVHTDCTTIAPVVNIPDNCLLAYTGLHDGYNKIVTSNYTTHQYKIGNAEPVTFFWNADEEVDVTIVELPSTSVYTYKLSEFPGDDGIYKAMLIPNFTPSVSMSTDGTLSLNFFIPEDVYTALKEAGGLNISSAYDYFEASGADLSQYGKSGAFAQIKVIGIDPANATDTVISVTFTIADDNDLSYEKTLVVSVLSYAQSVINNGNDTEKQYAVQLLNYVQAVMAYTGKNDDAAAIGEVITASGLTVNTGEDVIGDAVNDKNSATGVAEAEMNLGGSINWVITVEGNATYTVSYTRDGEVTSVERTAKDGKIVISLRAYDVLNNVTITNNSDNTSVTFNLADYYAGQGENAKAVLEALAAYAAEAAEYKAILDAASSN